MRGMGRPGWGEEDTEGTGVLNPLSTCSLPPTV